jgi:hypothetical protein
MIANVSPLEWKEEWEYKWQKKQTNKPMASMFDKNKFFHIHRANVYKQSDRNPREEILILALFLIMKTNQKVSVIIGIR